MKPEEHMIDSLLREHNRVSGEDDEQFLQELEGLLKKEENIIENPPIEINRITPLPTWAAAAAVACIIAAIGMSMYFTQQNKQLPLANNNKTSEQLEKSETQERGYTTTPPAKKTTPLVNNLDDNEDAPAAALKSATNDHVTEELSFNEELSINEGAVAEHAAKKMTSASKKISPGSYFESPSKKFLPNEANQLSEKNEYSTVLMTSFATLYQKRDAQLPAATKKLPKEKLAQFKLALTILENEHKLLHIKRNTEKESTKKIKRNARENNSNQKIAALLIFNEVFHSSQKSAVKALPRIAKAHPLTEDVSQSRDKKESLDLSATLQRWKKDLGD